MSQWIYRFQLGFDRRDQMSWKHPFHSAMVIAAVFMVAGSSLTCQAPGSKLRVVYEPTWESLKQHDTPEWFRDAKFGIYFHWGAYSVPAFGTEWYPRNMYREENNAYRYHRDTFGPQEEFGYKDFIPMFRAEKFDPAEWAELFKKAGAQFAGPVAEHHDGFAMWESELTGWDVGEMGPRRDITGELASAIRAQGIKLVTSFHHAFNWKYYEPSYTGNFDTKNPEYADLDGLYPTPHEPGEPESEEFLADWEAKVREVIDKYRPDYIWFDFGWQQPTFEPFIKSLLAYYYNEAGDWGKEVVVSYKDRALPIGVGVLDLERGKMETMQPFDWISDTSIDRRSWCYIQNPDYKAVNTLIDNLVDRVSKNGNLLLNIGPRPDGTIPDEVKQRLLEMGEWLEVNGEAIYGTRTWIQYGDGPTQMEGGSFGERKGLEYTAGDIRFTTKENILYATCLDWPGEEITISSLRLLHASEIKSITMLGHRGELEWSLGNDGLTIRTPDSKPCEHAFVFKITL